jgi:cell division protein FtsW
VLSWLGARQLVICTVGLCVIGTALVLSASTVRAAEMREGDWMFFVNRHVGGLLLGCLGALVAAQVPLSWVRRASYPAWLLATLLLGVTLVVGVAHKGGKRWLSLDTAFGGVEFQPLELAKLGVVLAVAHFLASHAHRVRDYRVGLLAPLALAGVPAAVLFFQPDFGGLVLIGACTALLAFAAGARISHWALAGAMVAVPVATLALYTPGYRSERISSWWNRLGAEQFADPVDKDHQARLALLSFKRGGLTGVGLSAGRGRETVPESHNDFILPIAGEELGLFGVLGILIGFLGIAWCSIAVALRAADPFGMLLATGTGLLLWLQAALNIAVAMDLLPTKGTTLPLLSYGRSSLIASLIAVGLLLNVARTPGFASAGRHHEDFWP